MDEQFLSAAFYQDPSLHQVAWAYPQPKVCLVFSLSDCLLVNITAFAMSFWGFFRNVCVCFYVSQLAGEAIKGLEDLERNQELKHS